MCCCELQLLHAAEWLAVLVYKWLPGPDSVCPAAGLRESWQDGTAFQALAARQAELSEQREAIEAARKVHHPRARLGLSPDAPLQHAPSLPGMQRAIASDRTVLAGATR